MPSYNIRAELTSRHDRDEVQLDLSSLHGPRLSEMNLTATVTLSGRVEVTVTIEAGDLWIAMLTCMAVLDHDHYDVTSWSAHTEPAASSTAE